MALALPPPMDYALDDDLGFFSRIFNKDLLVPGMAVMGGGAVGGMAYSYVSGWSFFNADWKKALLAAGLGIVGGSAIQDGVPGSVRSNMAMGHMGAMGYVLGAKLVEAIQGWMPSSGTSTDTEEEAAGTGPEGLFGMRAKRHQLHDADVESGSRFSDVDVSNENPLADDLPVSSWIS